MTKYKSGKDYIDDMNIRDFEFYNGFVKKGAKPHDKLGRPLSTGDVIKDITNLPDLIDKASTMTGDEPEANMIKAKIQRITEQISASSDWEDLELPENTTEAKAMISTLKNSLYQESEIEKLKVKAGIKPPKKLRHDQQCKLECRKVAPVIWAEDPDMTIVDMSARDEILAVSKKKNGNYYNDETIRNWIKDLCPNRKPGKRPKKAKK